MPNLRLDDIREQGALGGGALFEEGVPPDRDLAEIVAEIGIGIGIEIAKVRGGAETMRLPFDCPMVTLTPTLTPNP